MTSSLEKKVHVCVCAYDFFLIHNLQIIRHAIIFIVNSILPIDSPRICSLIFAKLLYSSSADGYNQIVID